jgi:hypothetical protein
MSEQDLLERIQRLENLVANLAQNGGTMRIDSNVIFSNQVEMRAARILALESGTEPTDPDACGSFMSAAGETFGDWLIKVGEVLNGRLQAGFGNGAMIFAGGEGVADETGLNLNGIRYALRHYATDPDGLNPRYGRFEMFYENGKVIPSLALTYMDGAPDTNLVANPDFETGDLSSWTPTTPARWTVTNSGPYEGEFCTHTVYTLAHGVTVDEYLTSARILVSSIANYNFSFAARNFLAGKGSSSVRVKLKWYDDATAGVLLRTDALPSVSSYYWLVKSAMFVAPVGAVSVVVEVDCHANNSEISADDTAEFYLDSFLLTQIQFERKILFGPEPEIYDGVSSRKILGGVKEIYIPQSPNAVLVATETGNCTDGAHCVKVTFVDVEGETLASGSSYPPVVVDASHKQITVPLPKGPWGTIARKVYLSTPAAINTFNLAATIADNTTTTINLSIADGDLGAGNPQYNTTGSRPLFPTYALIRWQLVNSNVKTSMFDWPSSDTGSSPYGFVAYGTDPTPAANGDWFEFEIFAASGTYTLIVHGIRHSHSGKLDIYEKTGSGDVLLSAALDFYGSGNALIVRTITFADNGLHRIRCVVNGKNASSTDYTIVIADMEFVGFPIYE